MHFKNFKFAMAGIQIIIQMAFVIAPVLCTPPTPKGLTGNVVSAAHGHAAALHVHHAMAVVPEGTGCHGYEKFEYPDLSEC